MKKTIDVCLMQAPLISGEIKQNLDWFERELASEKSNIDLLVLPEVFSTGFGPEARRMPSRKGDSVIEWMYKWARDLNCVVTGSLVFEEDGQYFNRLIWMQPDGDSQSYDKRHLFRMAGEHQRYSQGQQRVLVELGGWRLLPLVCYDLRFPVWSRNQGDYDMLLYVANWPAPRAEHWLALLKARAIENLSYCIGVNRIGEDSVGNSYQGDTIAFAPDGTTIAAMGDTEGHQIVTLSADFLKSYREQFPAFLDADRFTIRLDQ